MAEITILMHKSDGKVETITFLTDELTDGESLQSLAMNEGVRIGGACGGIGLCTTCRIAVLEGAEHLSHLTREEKDFRQRKLLKENERLACQCFPIHQDALIRVEVL